MDELSSGADAAAGLQSLRLAVRIGPAGDPGHSPSEPMRRGTSLLETLVVLALIGLMGALLMPAVQKARAAANRTVCRNNLHQIGLGIHMYHDAHEVLPFARVCPAPWQGGRDPRCLLASPPTTYTGPNEAWWCPYDNRPGATPTAALPDYRPAGPIAPFVENSVRVFRCPDGIDRTPGSPTRGAYFQIGYAINPDVGGRRLSDVGGYLLVTEHDDLPACRGSAGHFTPWPAGDAARADRHEPARHGGQPNRLAYDGSVPTGY